MVFNLALPGFARVVAAPAGGRRERQLYLRLPPPLQALCDSVFNPHAKIKCPQFLQALVRPSSSAARGCYFIFDPMIQRSPVSGSCSTLMRASPSCIRHSNSAWRICMVKYKIRQIRRTQAPLLKFRQVKLDCYTHRKRCILTNRCQKCHLIQFDLRAFFEA